MAASILSRPIGAATTKGATSEGAALTIDQTDRFTAALSSADAAVTMLIHLFSGEAGVDAKRSCSMGVLQFLDHTLQSVNAEIMEMDRPLDDLYWGVHHASSLVSVLEEVEAAEGFCWESLSYQLVVNYLSGVQSSLDRARASLQLLPQGVLQ